MDRFVLILPNFITRENLPVLIHKALNNTYNTSVTEISQSTSTFCIESQFAFFQYLKRVSYTAIKSEYDFKMLANQKCYVRKG